MKRVVALVVAAGLVGGAILVRRAIDDDGGDGPAVDEDGVATLACVPELEAVCDVFAAEVDGLQVRVEDAADTAASLNSPESGLDAWLTLAPWAEIADAQAGRDVTGDQRVVATTRLALVVWDDRRDALEAQACPDGVDWRCLGDASGQLFSAIGAPGVPGTVKVGHPPLSSAVGRLVLGSAVVGYFGRPDIGTNDFDADDGFLSWLRRLEREVGTQDPFLRMLQQGRGAFTAVGTTEAQAETQAGAQLDELDILYPAPVAIVPLVLVAVRGADRDDDILDLAGRQALRDGIVRAGFDPFDGDQPVAAEGLPAPGVLVALGDS